MNRQTVRKENEGKNIMKRKIQHWKKIMMDF